MKEAEIDLKESRDSHDVGTIHYTVRQITDSDRDHSHRISTEFSCWLIMEEMNVSNRKWLRASGKQR